MSDQTGEDGRLAALAKTGLLDTPAELRFDRFTRLAATLFKAPIALVSLIDENRQWFKSCVGLDTRETPREYAFCAHAIEAPGVFVILDATRDPRFAENPLVTGPPHIRFYAGAPLVLKDGHALGTLCIIDDKPRAALTEAETDALSDLAALVVEEIEATEEAQAREVAISELKHRMSNIFGQIGGLISLGDASDMSKQNYIHELRRRVMSMHDVNRRLADGDWNAADLGDVVRDTLRPALGDKAVPIVTPGPPVQVSARAAMTLSMAVSELAANSLKHGALSGDEGAVRVSWSVEGENFALSWEEDFPGRAAQPRSGRGGGFGSVLLQRIVPAELAGEAQHAVSSGRVRYVLTAPKSALSD